MGTENHFLSYYTIRGIGHGEYEEKKSRFLGEAIPVHSAQEAMFHLERIRKTHYDARHHCSAYVLGEKQEIRKSSDDGEPSGTAGLPILKVIEGLECTNTLVIVTRYFGGTLLGTGGLVRAYTAAAKHAMEDAGVVCMEAGEKLELRMEYSFLSPVRYSLEKEGIPISEVEYTDQVTLQITVPSRRSGEIQERIRAVGGGRIAVSVLEDGYYAF